MPNPASLIGCPLSGSSSPRTAMVRMPTSSVKVSVVCCPSVSVMVSG
jgi:hypothetical protein